MKIVIASDSFKGSLSSAEVAAAAASGVKSAVPSAEVVQLAVADGGEGTTETLVAALGAEWMACRADDPLGREIDVRYGVVDTPEGRTALIDLASASGLTLLDSDERDVMNASTRGTGQMILNAFSRGCRRFMIGIGGSATCDGGMGMLEALGVRFLDAAGRELPQGGGSLVSLARIDLSKALHEVLDCPFTVICDVENPLFGPEGAARVFGPQKGANPDEVEALDKGLRQYADIIKVVTGRDVASVAGAGAAGGVGAAFLAFFNARIRPGVKAVLDLVGFDKALHGADLVITGEGRIDRQTLYGKLPLGVCRRAAAAGVPTVAVAGMVEDTEALLKGGFAGVFSILQRPMTLDEAMSPGIAAANIAATTASIARIIQKTAL